MESNGGSCHLDCCINGDKDVPIENGSVYRYCEGHLNFATASHEDDDYYNKRKIARDPMSHRIIEKRRRDRMNNCLADLSRLIPADYLKKGRGRIEKTEIIEMAIKHMRHLQTVIATTRVSGGRDTSPTRPQVNMENYRLGYLECLSEAMHFLVEIQGLFSGDALCVQMMNHLHRHCDDILKADALNFPRQHLGDSVSSSNCSSSNGNGESPPLGMSNSVGSNSDEYPACSSESDEPQYLHRNYSSTSGVESIGVKEDPEGPSHLRDMLMSHGSRKSDSGYDPSSGEEHHMYKFKNTIQQRYNESRLLDVPEPPLKKLKLEETPVVGGRLSFGHKAQLVKPIPLLSTPKASHDQKPPKVPAFALHASGEFYIPLSLEQHFLSPHLPALTDKPPHKTSLHPVSISVNFHQHARSGS